MLDPWPDATARTELASNIAALLRADPRVREVVPFGSLAGDPDIPDGFSDIDLDVFIRAPGTDLSFAKSVRELVASIAPVRASRTIWLRGFGYVEALWFDGYPPYWHVDVRCRSDDHCEDAAYGTKDDWATGYTHWMLCAKRVARAFAFVGEHRAAVTGAPAALTIPAVVVDELRALLQVHHDACAGIPGRGEFYALCREVDGAVLTPARTD
jgi:predicted nucleotidyltransferase